MKQSEGIPAKIIHFQAEITEWISAKHNMGMAFTQVEWIKMVSCSDQFCKVG